MATGRTPTSASVLAVNGVSATTRFGAASAAGTEHREGDREQEGNPGAHAVSLEVEGPKPVELRPP